MRWYTVGPQKYMPIGPGGGGRSSFRRACESWSLIVIAGSSLLLDLHRALHVGVQRAVVAVDAGVLEGEARALALHQDVRLEGLARERHLVRREIGIGPGDRLAGLDGHARGA